MKEKEAAERKTCMARETGLHLLTGNRAFLKCHPYPVLPGDEQAYHSRPKRTPQSQRPQTTAWQMYPVTSTREPEQETPSCSFTHTQVQAY